MEKLIQLGSDMSLLWSNYSSAYLGGIRSTLILALVATVIGCVIGLICGILNTIPYNAYQAEDGINKQRKSTTLQDYLPFQSAPFAQCVQRNLMCQ